MTVALTVHCLHESISFKSLLLNSQIHSSDVDVPVATVHRLINTQDLVVSSLLQSVV